MSRRVFVILLLLVSLMAVYTAHATIGPDVLAQITIPTRTPTPDASNPTATPDDDDGGGGGGGGGGDDPPPAPTNPPAATATATLPPPTIPPTPEGGFLPTAEPCGMPPTAKTVGAISNVRGGPGTDYAVITQLVRNEVRPVAGRAGNAPWWVIELADGERAWVADVAVEVVGNTASVPIISPPALDGATPTPGAAWDPTPIADCATAVPTATSTSVTATPTTTLTPSPTETAEPTLTATPIITATEETTAAEAEVASAEMQDQDTETPPAPPEPDDSSDTPANTESDEGDTQSEDGAADPIAAAGGDSSSEIAMETTDEGGASAMLPIAGAIMIILGAVGLFMMRRRS